MSDGICEEIVKRSSDLVSRKIEHWRVARAVQILSIEIRSFYCNPARQAVWRAQANAMQAIAIYAFTRLGFRWNASRTLRSCLVIQKFFPNSSGPKGSILQFAEKANKSKRMHRV